MPLEQELREYIVGNYLPGEDPESVSPEDNLIDTGILDSMAIMQLVAHLEKHYAISILTEEINPEIFASTRTLAAYISGKQAKSEQPKKG